MLYLHSFLWSATSLLGTISHLGNLHYNLSDAEDINSKLRDMLRKADCLLATFPRVGPFILTHLFQSYCCPLYGSGLWSLLCPALQNIEVGFSKVLRRIWILPAHSHTCIVHLELPIFTAYSTSFIIVRIPFCMLLHIPSLLVQTIFMTPLLLFLWIKHHIWWLSSQGALFWGPSLCCSG